MYRSIMILPLTIPVAFFILCAASAVQSTFLVHQSPAILRADEGTRVILNCTFQSAGTLPSVWQASWWRGRVREGQLVSNSNWAFKGRVFISELEQLLLREGEVWRLLHARLPGKCGWRGRSRTRPEQCQMNATNPGPATAESQFQTVSSTGAQTPSFNNNKARRGQFSNIAPFIQIQERKALAEGRNMIAALQRSDAGVYYCEVEFLQYATRYGGGTTLEVIGEGDKDKYPPVYQYPLIIEANEGEAAEIVCVCYRSPDCPDLRLDLVRVSAGKEVSALSSSLRRRTESRPLESYNNASEVCVRVTGLEYSDSGEYKCRGYSGSGSVIVSGNATTVAVKSSWAEVLVDDDCSEDRVWIFVRIAITLALAVLSIAAALLPARTAEWLHQRSLL